VSLTQLQLQLLLQQHLPRMLHWQKLLLLLLQPQILRLPRQQTRRRR
jgi:hypothetical protein